MKPFHPYHEMLVDLKRRRNKLTHLSLASLLWDIGKQNSPRCDAAERGVPSGAILFAQRNFIEKRDKKIKITSNTPKNESGLTQLIMMEESIRQIWVNMFEKLRKSELQESIMRLSLNNQPHFPS